MKKLTSDTAHSLLARMKENATYVQHSIHEGYMIQALEIALPVLEQQEKSNGGWIEWKGGKCPVPPRAIVVVRYRKGKEETPGEAGGYFWCHAGSSVDIIAYRVVQDRERGEEE